MVTEKHRQTLCSLFFLKTTIYNWKFQLQTRCVYQVAVRATCGIPSFACLAAGETLHFFITTPCAKNRMGHGHLHQTSWPVLSYLSRKMAMKCRKIASLFRAPFMAIKPDSCWHGLNFMTMLVCKSETNHYDTSKTAIWHKGQYYMHNSHVSNLQDFDYFKRCVERFRNAVKAPGRKLFVVSCLVDSMQSLQEIKETDSNSKTENWESKGSKASWGYFAPKEVVKLFESLKQFGASDFKLSALVLCAGAASIAKTEPVIVAIPLADGCSGTQSLNSVVMFEVHLPVKTRVDDPFKFFEEETHDEAFSRAVLEGIPVCTELDEYNQDVYKPAGYRECLVDSSTSKDSGHLFACRCCSASFSSRNRLYAHIRSSPPCIRYVRETDDTGFQSLIGGKELATQVFALLIGSRMTQHELVEHLKTAIRCEVVECSASGHDLHNLCAVASTLLVKLSCTLRGEALLCHLRELLACERFVLHGCVPVSKSMALQHSSQHFAYLLPFQALSDEELPQQEIYRRFKQALNQVQKRWQSSDVTTADEEHALQMKMTQKLSFGSEYVVIKIVGDISSSSCCVLVARALALFHGSEAEIGSVPSELLYLEGQRFPHEKKHGPLFGRSCLPWGDHPALQSWRSELQRQLVEEVDWPEKAKSESCAAFNGGLWLGQITSLGP